MAGTLIVTIAVVTMMVKATTAAIYFHELSAKILHPDGLSSHSDFGHAMGFQNNTNNLIVGAPRLGLQGEVYHYNLNDLSYGRYNINVSAMGSPAKDIVNQHMFTGSSIAVTSNNFLTCAPLWPANVAFKQSDVVGMCFTVNNDNQKTTRTKGAWEEFKKFQRIPNKSIPPDQVVGGTGWNTLVDEDNGLIIIVKTFKAGDILYKPMNETSNVFKSMTITSAPPNNLKSYYNFGFGMSAGKFFSNATMYAFSMLTGSMTNAVEFIGYDTKHKSLHVENNKLGEDVGEKFTIKSGDINSAFGAVMAAADMNLDGFADLIIGAPVYSEDYLVECGALFIYKGRNMESIDKEYRQIVGHKELARFGSAIVTKDLDGDAIPEIVVGAPYEDDGLGALYVLSGFELKQKMEGSTTKYSLQDLKYYQRIQKKELRTLGFSLQFVGDLEKNGCFGLAVGAPESETVVLFKGIQFLPVNLTSTVVGKVTLRDKAFTVEVCAHVKYPSYPVNARIVISSRVIGDGTMLKTPISTIDIFCTNCKGVQKKCTSFIVELNNEAPGLYTFISEARLVEEPIVQNKVYDRAWAVSIPYMDMTKTIEVSRHCEGVDCMPKLSLSLFWKGKKEGNHIYLLGSSASEEAIVRVRNDGTSSYTACVRLHVSGAPIDPISDDLEKKGDYFFFRKIPFKNNNEETVHIPLNLTKPTSDVEELKVVADLFLDCNEDPDNSTELIVKYKLNTDELTVEGLHRNRNVTDSEINKRYSIFDIQEYRINNTGAVTWTDVEAEIVMDKKPFIHTVTINTKECKPAHTNEAFVYNCKMNLMPHSNKKIITTVEILKEKINDNLVDKKLTTNAEIRLYLPPTIIVKQSNLTSSIIFHKELTFAHSKWLIIIISTCVALIILAVLVLVLYKCGFFRRKQKERLQELRASIRRKPHITKVPSEINSEGISDIQINDEDESPFEEVTIRNKDCVIVTEESAQVHR